MPLVRFELLVDAGYAADRDESAGLAKLALALLPEGTQDAQRPRDRRAARAARRRAGDALESRSLDRRALRAAREPRRIARDLRRRDPAAGVRARGRRAATQAAAGCDRAGAEDSAPARPASVPASALRRGPSLRPLAHGLGNAGDGRAPLARGPRELPPHVVSSRSARRSWWPATRRSPRSRPGSRRCSGSGSRASLRARRRKDARAGCAGRGADRLPDRSPRRAAVADRGRRSRPPEERSPRRGARRLQPAAGRQLLGAHQHESAREASTGPTAPTAR